jgi:hypothetical protein
MAAGGRRQCGLRELGWSWGGTQPRQIAVAVRQRSTWCRQACHVVTCATLVLLTT